MAACGKAVFWLPLTSETSQKMCEGLEVKEPEHPACSCLASPKRCCEDSNEHTLAIPFKGLMAASIRKAS